MRLFSSQTIAAMRNSIAAGQPKAQAWQQLVQRVDAWCAVPAELPNVSGGWIHKYICPTTWLPLMYDGNRPNEHRSPAGTTCEGVAYDEAWLAWRHREIADMSRDAALAFVITNEARYLAEVERILLHYAAFYSNFAGADTAEAWMIPARVFNQALTEALWAIPAIHAFDLVADALDADVREKIVVDLLEPLGNAMVQAQDSLINNNNVKSNYMAWFNAVLGCVGYTIGNPTFVEKAIDGPGGFVAHLDVGVLTDGMQYEVTPYYHNFVVLAYIILAEAAKTNGRDLYSHTSATGQSIATMWRAMTRLTLPDGTIADLGDGSYWIDSIFDRELIEVYEVALARDDFFSSGLSATLAHAYARSHRERNSWAALLYGLNTPDLNTTMRAAVEVLPDAGVALLPASSGLVAVAPFGAMRGSHSHGDQLSLQVWPFSNDAGCVLYGIPARFDWYQDIYAHNSLVIDGVSPKEFGQAAHQLTDSKAGPMLSLEATNYYPAQVSRQVQAGRNTLTDSLSVTADDTHTYDWVFYVDGDLTLQNHAATTVNKPLGDTTATAQIQLTKQLDAVNSAIFHITHTEQAYTLRLQTAAPVTLMLGNAPGTSWDPTQRRHVIVARSVGKDQSYNMVISHD